MFPTAFCSTEGGCGKRKLCKAWVVVVWKPFIFYNRSAMAEPTMTFNYFSSVLLLLTALQLSKRIIINQIEPRGR